MSDWRDVILHDMTSQERLTLEAEGQRIASDARTIAKARNALALTQLQVAKCDGDTPRRSLADGEAKQHDDFYNPVLYRDHGREA